MSHFKPIGKIGVIKTKLDIPVAVWSSGLKYSHSSSYRIQCETVLFWQGLKLVWHIFVHHLLWLSLGLLFKWVNESPFKLVDFFPPGFCSTLCSTADGVDK